MPEQTLTRIACVQMQPAIGEVEANVERSSALIINSAGLGAKVVVLPELANTGYAFATRDEAFALAETIPDGPSIARWQRVASEYKLYLVAGIAERDGTALYDTAVLLGPDGFIGRYRKLHLWDAETLFFEPGNLGLPVFTTPIGRIGLAICYDAWFPETFRLLALQGAELVCVPTNWVRPSKPVIAPQGMPYSMAHMLLIAAAHSNSINIATADRIGIERGQPFEGRSVIVGHSGWPVAGPASYDREELVIGDIDLANAREARAWTKFNQILRDRRNDLYGEMLGSTLPRGWY